MPDTNDARVPNPRGDRRGGERRPLGTPAQTGGLWYFVAFLAVLLIGQALLTTPASQTISYSEFKEMVRAGQVDEVLVGQYQIRGVLNIEERAPGRAFTVTRIEDPNLIAELDQHGVRYTGEVASQWQFLVWVLPLFLLVALGVVFLRRLGGARGGLMSFSRSHAKIYAEDDVKVSFADVAGVDEAESELREIVEFLQNPTKYTRLGGHIPKGVLLVGPPGTGKTLLARAVAGEARVPFFSLSGSEFVEMFVGVGAARVRDLFAQAELRAPCIVFIDELDALGKLRVMSPMGSHEEREQTLNQLLAEMDGFDSRKGVIIMGATNRPEVLDPALLRPGRFDRHVLVDKPDVRGREEILRLHTNVIKVAPTVDLRVVAARTAGFVGADLANLVNEAALLAARRDKPDVGMDEIDEAIDRLVVGLEKKRVMSLKEREIVAFHEAGHAIVASVLPGLDPVHKISIVQRGISGLGYTMQLPLEDRYLMTKTDLLSQLSMLLAGRAAEEIALHQMSTGAQNDLHRATDIARAMVTEFGMSETLGAISFNGQHHALVPVPQLVERPPYGERTAEQIDIEVRRLLTEASDQARHVLAGRRQALERIARRLLQQEVIERGELQALLKREEAPAEQPWSVAGCS